MSWRIVVVGSRGKLDLKMGYLVVRTSDETKKIHLSEVSMLILECTGISITIALLAELSLRKIKVIICDNKRNPCSELVSYYGSHDCSRKIEKQIKWNNQIKKIVWTEIVTEKIRQQRVFLNNLSKTSEAALLSQYINEIEFADVTNREGHAAKVYFNGIFGMDFTRSADNAINAGLNYGYTILLSAFNREITTNGYLTQLGIFHNNMFNQFNLSSDLMEPYRVLVDRIVYENKFNVFEKKEKMLLVNMLNYQIRIDGKEQFVNNAIKIYCRSVFEAIEENDISLIKFYNYEL